jgi:hypothetical protein
MCPAARERVHMVKLEAAAFAAALAILGHERASIAIALAHRAAHGCRDMAGSRGRRLRRCRFSWPPRLCVPLLVDRGELLRDRQIDQRRQIAIGHLMTQLVRQTLELALELRARGELHLVASRR